MSDIDTSEGTILEVLNSKVDTNLKNIDSTLPPRVTRLFGTGNTITTSGNLSLSESWKNFDMIEFINSMDSEVNVYNNVNTFTVEALKDIQRFNGYFALFGYDQRYARLNIVNDTTFAITSQGQGGTQGVISIWGIRFLK